MENKYKLSDLIRSGLTAELLWEKERKAPIWNEKEYFEYKKQYHENVSWDICNAGYLRQKSTEINMGDLNYILKKNFTVIYDLLSLFPENLYL